MDNVKMILIIFKKHSKIPWGALSGLRNRIVHDYGNVDLSVVYDTLKYDIPEMLGLIVEGYKINIME